MNRFAFASLVCLFLMSGAQASFAQAQPATVLDAQNPPAGFVPPKPAEERDLSMAKYARDSFLDGEEGIVGLRLLVRQDGSVGEARITTSSGSLRLDAAAQDVVKGWRYVPATMNGASVEASIAV